MHQVRNIKLEEIRTSELNPRKTFDSTEIEELAQSIKENGLINAITLRKVKGDNGIKYEVVCGERRYRAVQLLNLETIQAVVKELDDKQAFTCMVIENLQRKDIDPLEEASAIRYLYKESEVPVKEIAKIIGKSTSFVINRIQLNNIIEEFVGLLRNEILNLSHLQEIAKLTKEQQRTLFERCFQPANIERWNFKTLSVEKVKEWIDEHVMCHISSAIFDPTDETYTACKACIGCKFNTATHITYRDSDSPRCMKQEFFRAKTQEAIFRKAKDLGFPVVYSGSVDENRQIIQAAQAFQLYPQPLGTREYLIEPTPPQDDCDVNDKRYQKRLANYERIRAVFEDNINAGIVIKVFEISYNGILSGEIKYLFNLKADEVGRVEESDTIKAEQLSMFKKELRAADESKQIERVERQRAFMQTASFSEKNEMLDATEENIFLALLVSRLSQEFRKAIGMDYESAVDIRTAFPKLEQNKGIIMREFIRMVLSDKSVGYSSGFASLLDIALNHSFGTKVQEIDRKLAEDYAQKCDEYKARIEELEKELQSKNVAP